MHFLAAINSVTFARDMETILPETNVLISNAPRGGYSLIRGEWGCAAGWGRIFTTRLTIMGSRFQ